MIRSEVGDTARTTLVAKTACASEPSWRAFTTCVECVLAERRAFSVIVIACPLRPSPDYARSVIRC